jgi:hypothetical protein
MNYSDLVVAHYVGYEDETVSDAKYESGWTHALKKLITSVDDLPIYNSRQFPVFYPKKDYDIIFFSPAILDSRFFAIPKINSFYVGWLGEGIHCSIKYIVYARQILDLIIIHSPEVYRDVLKHVPMNEHYKYAFIPPGYNDSVFYNKQQNRSLRLSYLGQNSLLPSIFGRSKSSVLAQLEEELGSDFLFASNRYAEKACDTYNDSVLAVDFPIFENNLGQRIVATMACGNVLLQNYRCTPSMTEMGFYPNKHYIEYYSVDDLIYKVKTTPQEKIESIVKNTNEVLSNYTFTNQLKTILDAVLIRMS